MTQTIATKSFFPEFIVEADTKGILNRIRWEFPNGWGASVISCIHKNSNVLFGFDFELAVMLNGEPNYENPLTNDVIWGNGVDIVQYLNEIYSWPANSLPINPKE